MNACPQLLLLAFNCLIGMLFIEMQNVTLNIILSRWFILSAVVIW